MMPPKTDPQERKKQSAIRAANGALSKLGEKQYGTPEYLRFIAYAISALEKVTNDGPDGLLNPFDDTDKKLIREFKQKLGRLKQEQATLQKEISESKASSAVYGGYQAGGSGGTGQGNLELQRQRAELFAKSSASATIIPSRYETEEEINRRELLGEHYQTPWQRQQQKSQQQQQLQRQQKKSAPDADVVEIEPGSLGDLDVRRSGGQNERDPLLTERRSRSHGSGVSGYVSTDRDINDLVRKTESLAGGDSFQKRAPSKKVQAKTSSSSFSLFN